MPDKIPPWALPALPGETPAETKARRDDAYFAWQLEENDEWRARMGRSFDVKGKRVLEIGCGHGALSLLMAQEGASEVIGVDLEQDLIEYASRNAAARYPELAPKVRFLSKDIAELDGSFDVIITKDTFEHIDDMRTALDHIYRLLAPGGVLASGFSPLYYSPFGDHGRYHLGGAPGCTPSFPNGCCSRSPRGAAASGSAAPPMSGSTSSPGRNSSATWRNSRGEASTFA